MILGSAQVLLCVAWITNWKRPDTPPLELSVVGLLIGIGLITYGVLGGS